MKKANNRYMKMKSINTVLSMYETGSRAGSGSRENMNACPCESGSKATSTSKKQKSNKRFQ